MSLWGNKDTKGMTGTVTATNGSAAILGASTLFTTELKAGQTLVIASVEYKVDSITDNTHATLHTVYAGSTAAGLIVTANEQPAYVLDTERAAVYGVNLTEAQVASNIAKGIKTPGWVKYTTYTDAQGTTRHKAETLVAMGSGLTAGVASDASDDAVVADA